LERYRVLRIYRLFLFFKKEMKVKKKSDLIIPVSCTEQGRWSYQTDEFFNSENILSYKIRGKKAAFVSDPLKQSWIMIPTRELSGMRYRNYQPGQEFILLPKR